MKKYLTLVFAVLFVACQHKKEISIESIEVLFYNGIFERVMAVGCDEIVYSPFEVDTIHEILDNDSYLPKQAVILQTTITDKSILHEVELELNKRIIIEENSVDARMKCYITYSNGQIDSLCIDNNPNYGIYNDKSVKLTNKFVYLIRENCGFYKWIGIERGLEYFEELNDTTFVREPVISRSGEKY